MSSAIHARNATPSAMFPACRSGLSRALEVLRIAACLIFSSRIMRDSIGPGRIALTLMRVPATSSAAVRVRPSTACLEATCRTARRDRGSPTSMPY